MSDPLFEIKMPKRFFSTASYYVLFIFFCFIFYCFFLGAVDLIEGRYKSPAELFVVTAILLTIVPMLVFFLFMLFGAMVRRTFATFYEEFVVLYPDFFCRMIVPKNSVKNIVVTDGVFRGVEGLVFCVEIKNLDAELKKYHFIKRFYLRFVIYSLQGKIWTLAKSYDVPREKIVEFANSWL